MAQRHIARRLMKLVVLYYVDDCHVVEPEVTAGGAKRIFQDLMALLG